MAHSHENNEVSLNRLLITILLNLVITVLQIVGGLISGSLALLSDAIHNLSDSISIILAYFAQVLSKKPSTQKSTFGYKRAEILAAFINAVSLIGISIFLIFEAISRISKPQEIDVRWMFWLGLLGFIANGISVLLLVSEKDKNINIKAAYLHLFGDALTSIAVILGALLIWKFNIIWVDSVVTILISIYLLVHTLKLLKESVTILMQIAPSHLNVNEIKKQLLKIVALENIHHIHLWNLTDKLIHFECHINLKENIKISKTTAISEDVRKILHDKFDVEHITIQFEYKSESNCEEC